MNLTELIDFLQNWAHLGNAEDKIEIWDSEGALSVPSNIKIKKENNVTKIMLIE